MNLMIIIASLQLRFLFLILFAYNLELFNRQLLYVLTLSIIHNHIILIYFSVNLYQELHHFTLKININYYISSHSDHKVYQIHLIFLKGN